MEWIHSIFLLHSIHLIPFPYIPCIPFFILTCELSIKHWFWCVIVLVVVVTVLWSWRQLSIMTMDRTSQTSLLLSASLGCVPNCIAVCCWTLKCEESLSFFSLQYSLQRLSIINLYFNKMNRKFTLRGLCLQRYVLIVQHWNEISPTKKSNPSPLKN